MRLAHIGIVVDDIDRAAERYATLGYTPGFRVRRAEPWIGEIVGFEGADIEICYLRRKGDLVALELLRYHSSTGPRLGTQHVCYEVAAAPSLPGFTLRGSATIPDGPNAGTVCCYYEGPDGDIIETMQRPSRMTTDETIEAIQAVRARTNEHWMRIVRLVMELDPARARVIFDDIEANDAEILSLSAHLRHATAPSPG